MLQLDPNRRLLVMTRWESLDTLFKALYWIRLRGKFALYPQGNEVLGTAAAVIVEQKRRWDNRSEIEKDGVCLSTLIQQFHHLECSNILDKVYGLLGLSCDGHMLEVDYDKSPDTVCEEVLKVVYNTQISDPHDRKLFEDLLCRVFGLEKIPHARATMEDTVGGAGSGHARDYNRRIYRTSQPVSGEPEFEVGYTSSIFLQDSEAVDLGYDFGSSLILDCWRSHESPTTSMVSDNLNDTRHSNKYQQSDHQDYQSGPRSINKQDPQGEFIRVICC
jgi:hypothetical protein